MNKGISLEKEEHHWFPWKCLWIEISLKRNKYDVDIVSFKYNMLVLADAVQSQT